MLGYLLAWPLTSGAVFLNYLREDSGEYHRTERQIAGVSAVNVRPYHLLTTETRNGTWRLRVQDATAADNGFINTCPRTTSTRCGPSGLWPDGRPHR